MDYIDNITLSILIRLLLGGDVVLDVKNLESLEELRIYASTLDVLFKEKPENMTLEEEEEFEENYNPCITYSTSNCPCRITISCNNQDHLTRYLTEYAQLFKIGELQEKGYTNTFESIETLDEDIRNLTKDIRVAKTRYKVNDIRFAPLMLSKYLDNPEFIRSLIIEMVSPDEMPYPIRLYDYDSSEEITGMNDVWQDYFSCRYEVNMAWYLDEHNKQTSEVVTTKRRIKYSKQQRKMLEYIINTVDKTQFLDIEPYYLMRACKIKEDNIDMAVSRLNKEYREINNTDKTLVKKSKGRGFYEILPNFIRLEEN